MSFSKQTSLRNSYWPIELEARDDFDEIGPLGFVEEMFLAFVLHCRYRHSCSSDLFVLLHFLLKFHNSPNSLSPTPTKKFFRTNSLSPTQTNKVESKSRRFQEISFKINSKVLILSIWWLQPHRQSTEIENSLEVADVRVELWKLRNGQTKSRTEKFGRQDFVEDAQKFGKGVAAESSRYE